MSDLPTSSATINDESGREWSLLFYEDRCDLVDLDSGKVVDTHGSSHDIQDIFVRNRRLVFLAADRGTETFHHWNGDQWGISAKAPPGPAPGLRIEVFGAMLPCCRGRCQCHKQSQDHPMCDACTGAIERFIARYFPHPSDPGDQ